MHLATFLNPEWRSVKNGRFLQVCCSSSEVNWREEGRTRGTSKKRPVHDSGVEFRRNRGRRKEADEETCEEACDATRRDGDVMERGLIKRIRIRVDAT